MGGEAGPRPPGLVPWSSGVGASCGRAGRSLGRPRPVTVTWPGSRCPSPCPSRRPALPGLPLGPARPGVPAVRLPLPTPHVRPACKCLECLRLWRRILSIYSRAVHRMPPQLFPGQQLPPSLITSHWWLQTRIWERGALPPVP